MFLLALHFNYLASCLKCSRTLVENCRFLPAFGTSVTNFLEIFIISKLEFLGYIVRHCFCVIARLAILI